MWFPVLVPHSDPDNYAFSRKARRDVFSTHISKNFVWNRPKRLKSHKLLHYVQLSSVLNHLGCCYSPRKMHCAALEGQI